ncbi:MAG TPA: isoprenylcysteine carboxylmethyltransferase family protein [Kiritimatiellia bacterium]|nr:isoprenylcysteine carboxylmethyltransferase family protein [Kiritimatiellia bacterium]
MNNRRFQMLELKIPPAVVFLVCAGAMRGLDLACSFAAFDFPGRQAAAYAIFLPGAVLGLGGVATFLFARTTLHPERPQRASKLVTTGIYRISRNPMYAGLLCVLAGGALALGNALALLAPAAFVAYMNRFQIRPEERALREKFGAAFDAYAGAVRRWL